MRREQFWQKFITYLLWIGIAIFLLCVILPQGEGLTTILRTRKVFYVVLFLLLCKACFVWRNHPRSQYLQYLPFLLYFLISCFWFSRFPVLKFGVDDSHYYSYVASAFIDHDLDFANQYKQSGLEQYQDRRAREERTPIGLVPNIFPVGLSVFLTPFFLIGYTIAALGGFPLDGFSRPFVFAVGIGNLFYAFAGFYFCYLFCCSFVSRLISMFATFAVALTTPHLVVYLGAFVLISEPLSLCLGAAMLWIVVRSGEQLSALRCFLFGLLLGAMTMVRFHNIVFGIAPVLFLVHQAKKHQTFSQLPKLLTIFICGAIAGFFPQLVAWRLIYGSWFVNLGSFIPWWKTPFVLESLFSSRKGLLPWSPLILFCIAGIALLIRKSRIWALILAVILLATIYINAAQADWWAATSLGARRFVPLVSVFAAGFAILVSMIPRFWKLLAVPSTIALIFLNFHFVDGFRYGTIHHEHADRFAGILQGPYSPFRYIIEPLEFPVQLAYHLQYGTSMYGTLTEFFIGEDVFYFQERAGDEILSKQSPIFGNGWKVNGEGKTTAKDAIVYVPMFMKEKPRFFIELYLEPTGTEKDVWVDFYWNGEFLRSRKVFVDGRSIEIAIRSKEYRSAMNELRMHIYHSNSENEATPELILSKIQFRRNQIGGDQP